MKCTGFFGSTVRSFVVVCVLSMSCLAVAEPIRVGSKNFNESYVLAEIAAQLLESKGLEVERRFGLGGTLICYEALRAGEIDLYVEYTGTLSQAILKLPGNPQRAELNKHLAPEGLVLLEEIGFNNTFAIAVRANVAQQYALKSIGDLRKVPELELVFSHEFVEREDGWPGLSRTYGLDFSVRGIEHALAYKAIDEGTIGVTDAYSTDGELVRYALKVLVDDKNYFPSYFAAPLVRKDLSVAALDALQTLKGTISDTVMQEMNAQVVFEGLSFAQVAAAYLQDHGIKSETSERTIAADLYRNTLRHLQLTGISLALSIVFGLTLALLVYKSSLWSGVIIYTCGLMQTIPSIALLALMIPLFGIGMVPAIVALFMYSLLPILRNAITALTNVDATLVKVATALGLTQKEKLRYVLIPLSLPAIFAGIRTAAVISIGTATLAAFIGAGGLGDPIVVGLSLDNVNLILQGAIPAALLAIVTEILFGLLERRITRINRTS